VGAARRSWPPEVGRVGEDGDPTVTKVLKRGGALAITRRDLSLVSP
jgi:hypothetical protein